MSHLIRRITQWARNFFIKCLLFVKKLRHREIKLPSKGDAFRKWQNWDLNPASLTLELVISTTMLFYFQQDDSGVKDSESPPEL